MINRRYILKIMSDSKFDNSFWVGCEVDLGTILYFFDRDRASQVLIEPDRVEIYQNNKEVLRFIELNNY